MHFFELTSVLYKNTMELTKRVGKIQRKGVYCMAQNRLAEIRESLGYSQAQLADLVGVSRQTISSIERGNADPSVSLALKIAAVCNCSVHDIFFMETGGNTAYYCPHCRVLNAVPVCEICGKTRLPPAKVNDAVFLTELDFFASGILESALNEKKIPYEKDGLLGRGFTLRAGTKLERFRFFVPFGAYKVCKELVETLFSAEA